MNYRGRLAAAGIVGLFVSLGTGCNSDAVSGLDELGDIGTTGSEGSTGTPAVPVSETQSEARSVESESDEYGVYRTHMAAFRAETEIDYTTIPYESRACSFGNEPTAEQQKMMHLVNMARLDPRHCGDEYYPSTTTLSWNCELEDAAWMHSQDMVDNNFFAHAGSDGLHAGERVEASGYNWKVYGENLAAGFYSEEAALNALLDSPGHCKNIMNSKVKEFGSGRIFADNNDYISYWTHVFGTEF